MVVGVLLDNALLNSICNVSRILLGWRDPAVADQESLQVPCGFGVLLVAIENCPGDVRNVLSSIGLACDVDLDSLSILTFS